MRASLAGAAGLNLVVNDTSDRVDSSAGDGVCRTSVGTCTLRAAVQEANAIAGADTIQVPTGTYAIAIAPGSQNDVTTGDLDVTDSLTISGAGAGSTIVDAGTPPSGAPPERRGLDRLFEVLVDDGTVTYSGLTLSDGYAAEYGGAILNNSTATVTVIASSVTGSTAGKTGGGIDNHLGGAVDVQDSTLSGNVAFENGSALNNNLDGALTVTNSTVSANSAALVGLDENLMGAGAISNNAEHDELGTIIVTGSRISDNRAGGARPGAGISNDGAGTLIVDQTTFSKNRSTGDGGAIFNGTGDVTVTDSTFSENVGKDGGGIASKGGAVTVLDSSFSKNTAEDWGGGVMNGNQGSATIRNSTFSENIGLNGGGVGNDGPSLTVESSTFTKNSAVDTVALAGGEGGGMHSNSGGEVVLTGGSFTENKAHAGGGFSNEGGGRVTITGTRFSANVSEGPGGGVLVEGGDVHMVDIDVVGNVSESPEEGGGGISYAGDKAVSIGESGAIENSRIRDNKSKSEGGGIDSRGDGPLLITTTAITGNTAAVGGAIHHVGDATLAVTRSTLSGNFAEHGGGVLTDGDGEATIENTTVSGNRAGQFGGGLLVSARLIVRNSTVANNLAASGGGVNNGGGDLVGDGFVFLRNSIVANNPAGGNCAGIMTSLGGNVENSDSCQLREMTDQPGTDPLLGPLADNGGPTQTHALLADSPAQDKAVCTELDPCPSVDQRGVGRPKVAGFDVGAYESQLAPGGGGTPQCAGRTERPVLADFDSWLSQSAAAANFGSDGILKVESQSSGNERALVHFPLPTVPPGCKLVGATLRLYASAATNGRTLEALRLASDWSESGVTWSNQSATAGPAATTDSGLGFREWDVLAQARDMYMFGSHGFVIRDGAENGSGAQSFHSREKGIDRPPELVLVFDDPDAPPQTGVCPKVPQLLSADRDSWVSQSSPSNNSGNDSTLKVKSQSGSNSRALVRFALPALPPGCTTVSSATLRLEASSSKEGHTLQALQLASSWTETGVTWSSQPATTGPAATAPSAQGASEWDVTSQTLGIYVQGNHGFLIRDAAENGAGDEQAFNSREKGDSPPELVFVFDDSTPETTIDSGPVSPIDEADATFTFFSDRDDATFECSLDGAAFRACTSPHAIGGLTEGHHRLEVRSTRRVRAVDPTSASYSWTIDLTAPETTIGDRPADATNETSATFAFSGSDDLDASAQLRFQCRLDSAQETAWAACASPKGYELLAEGSHSFEVRALDRAGNVGSPASHSWTVDQTAPETAIGDRPADPSGSNSASFALGGSDNLDAREQLRFQCRLDHPASHWADCASPKGYSELAAGRHSFEVRALDRAGNTDASPDSYSWTIDLTAPESAIVGDRTADATNSRSASLSFTGSDNLDTSAQLRFQCRLDSAQETAWAACASPKGYELLAEGSHSFEVRALDRAGNVGSPAGHSWTVDLTPPETTIESGPDDPTQSGAASFSFSADEQGSTFECSLDGAAVEPCASPAEYGGLADGAHQFQVRATDQIGNLEPEPANYEWTVDTTPPETRIDSGPADPTNSTSAGFGFSADEPGAMFECALDDAPFSSCGSPTDYARLAPGPHLFRVQATDRAGNREPDPTSYAWTIDTRPPETRIESGPDAITKDTSATFGFSADEPGSTFECSLDAAPFAACTSPAPYTDLAPGEHVFRVRAIDRAGNSDPEPAAYAWTIDTRPPETTIDSGPADPTTSTSASFAFSADEPGATFECSLDDAPFAACPSPAPYSDLAPGEHTFRVQATDPAGNVEETPATYTWAVDTTPPETAIGDRPIDPSNQTSASFGFDGNDNVSGPSALRFQCRFDSVEEAAFEGCSSPHGYTGLAPGPHTFEVRAIDRAGNVDESPAGFSWTIDTTRPNTAISGGPADPTNSTAASFVFSADEPGSSFQCSLDEAPLASCASPTDYTLLEPGAHQFHVRATDRAGNVEESAAGYSWTIDTTPPQTRIDSGPDARTTSTSASFRFSADESSSFECSLDAAAFTPCASPTDYTGLEPGPHSFRVQATDSAGNTDAEPAVYQWVIEAPDTTPPDTTPPDTSIGDRPADPTNSSSASFTFDGTDSETPPSLIEFECRLDSVEAAGWMDCFSPRSYSGLGPGLHTFEVRAIDGAGNADPEPAGYSWTVDTVAPQTNIDSAPNTTTSSTSAMFAFSANEQGSTFECSLDGAAFAACSSPRQYSGLAAGAHQFRVQAIDRAGNTDPTPAAQSWTVDTAAPQTTIDSGPPAITSSTSAGFTFSASEPGSTFECSLDGAAFAACTSPRQYSGLAAGAHQFQVRAKDPAGNTDATPAAHSWTIDTTPPQTTIDSGPNAQTNSTNATFAFSSSEAGSTFECALDSAPFATCTSPREYTGLAAAAHQFQVRAKDPAGNTDATPAAHSWTIDTTSPQTTIDSGPPATTTSTSATFAFSATETGSTFDCSLDGAAFAGCTSPREYTGLAVGGHDFRVRAKDAAGNLDGSPASYSWAIQAPVSCTGPWTVTAGANADSWVLQSSSSSNYGNDSVVKVDSKAGGNARALFRFTLPAIPPGCQVTDARLRLFASSYKQGRTLQALRLGAGWTESGVTWSNQPVTTGAAATALSPSTSSYVQWSVTVQVQSMYSSGNHGFLVRDSVESGNGIEQAFHSREKAPDNPPQLVITFG